MNSHICIEIPFQRNELHPKSQPDALLVQELNSPGRILQSFSCLYTVLKIKEGTLRKEPSSGSLALGSSKAFVHMIVL